MKIKIGYFGQTYEIKCVWRPVALVSGFRERPVWLSDVSFQQLNAARVFLIFLLKVGSLCDIVTYVEFCLFISRLHDPDEKTIWSVGEELEIRVERRLRVEEGEDERILQANCLISNSPRTSNHGNLTDNESESKGKVSGIHVLDIFVNCVERV